MRKSRIEEKRKKRRQNFIIIIMRKRLTEAKRRQLLRSRKRPPDGPLSLLWYLCTLLASLTAQQLARQSDYTLFSSPVSSAATFSLNQKQSELCDRGGSERNSRAKGRRKHFEIVFRSGEEWKEVDGFDWSGRGQESVVLECRQYSAVLHERRARKGVFSINQLMHIETGNGLNSRRPTTWGLKRGAEVGFSFASHIDGQADGKQTLL